MSSRLLAEPLTPGLMIADRYRVVGPIASGGMGEVWEAEHLELKLKVALKVLRPEAYGDREIVTRFSREAFLLGRIHSEHVARVLDFVAEAPCGPVLVMEFVEGESLSHFLNRRRLTVEEAIELGIDIATALRELHRARVVHRDVKPGNIILRPRPEGGHRVVFVDLGVSRLVTDGEEEEALTGLTSADRAVGTLEYMAPEQILCSRDVTESADVYAVGAILSRAIEGRHPFGDTRGMDLVRRKLSEDAPPVDTGRSDRVAVEFEGMVARTLARSPSDRYELAGELLADLSLLRDVSRRGAEDDETIVRASASAAEEPSPSGPAQDIGWGRTLPPSPPPPRSPSWRWAWGALALTVGAAGGLLFNAVHKHPTRPERPVAALPASAPPDACTVAVHGEDGARPDPKRFSFSVSCDDRATASWAHGGTGGARSSLTSAARSP